MPSPSSFYIVINGQSLSGFTEISLTRSVESYPSNFTLSVSEKYETINTFIQAGNPIQIYLNEQLALTGYVDTVNYQMNAESHNVTIVGRGKGADLVDCSSLILQSTTSTQSTSATNTNYATQTVSANYLQTCNVLAKPFGITVNKLSDSTYSNQLKNNPVIVNLGESVYEAIEALSRFLGYLIYEDENGNVSLSGLAGISTMASGVTEGINVQSVSVSYSMNNRFSEYLGVISQINLTELSGVVTSPFVANAQDTQVPRFRPLVLVSEQYSNTVDQTYAQTRVNWQRNRNIGRSQRVSVIVDSWCDAAGNLWQPNYFIPASIPSMKVDNTNDWVICDVTFELSIDTGTTAELVLMPSASLTPEPAYPYGSGGFAESGLS